MKLTVSQMLEGENSFHFDSLQEKWLAEAVREWGTKDAQIEGGLRVDLKVVKLEPDYYVQGKLGTTLRLNCARCAESFAAPIRQDFDLALAQVSQARGRNVALAEESEELDVCYFEGNEIDLVPLIAEQFVLSVPYRSLCRPDCRGLCQQCGKNLNQGECGCRVENPINPFNVLKNMKQAH
jgi:uncharacterized protein